MPGVYALKVLFKSSFELLKSKNGRKFLWLCFMIGDKRRNTPGNVSISGRKFRYTDNWSFLWQYYEIYFKRYYHFTTLQTNPLIFDCGANVGLSSLYFVQHIDNAQILAFEPDGQLVDTFAENITESNVTLIPKAVWIHDNGVKMKLQGADTGHIQTDGDIDVQSVRLRDMLMEHPKIDFLKMDIEGAELEVIQDCGQYLNKVGNIFIEFHSRPHEKQQLGKIIQILEDAGFRLFIHNEKIYDKEPLTKDRTSDMFDSQLNIFGVNAKLT